MAMNRVRSPLLRLLLVNALLGVVIGEVCLAALLASDAAGIWTLITNAADPVIPLVMLAAVFAITFSSCVMATAVISMPAPSDRERR